MWKNLHNRIGQIFQGPRKPLYFAGVFFVILICVVYAFWMSGGGKRADGEDIKLKIIPDQVDLQIKDIHFTEVGDPDLVWEIQADTARYMKKDNLAHFEHVRIRLTRKDGKTLTLTGNEGILHTDTKDADVTGRVVITSTNGDVVETDKLHYSQGQRMITTKGKISLQNKRMEVSGEGMTMSLGEEKLALLSNVRAVIKTGKARK